MADEHKNDDAPAAVPHDYETRGVPDVEPHDVGTVVEADWSEEYRKGYHDGFKRGVAKRTFHSGNEVLETFVPGYTPPETISEDPLVEPEPEKKPAKKKPGRKKKSKE